MRSTCCCKQIGGCSTSELSVMLQSPLSADCWFPLKTFQTHKNAHASTLMATSGMPQHPKTEHGFVRMALQYVCTTYCTLWYQISAIPKRCL